jgi:predicted nucleic acid-binding protein
MTDTTATLNAAAVLAARRRHNGRPIEIRDAQIAGIALAARATLATRNIRHFADLGIALVDPWPRAEIADHLVSGPARRAM